ncbi:hypothetical protein AAVH_43031 [Aphelenchoides avenae]|nr:hypothetical protein AAVH_43031 [Aphelenchus avenae]
MTSIHSSKVSVTALLFLACMFSQIEQSQSYWIWCPYTQSYQYYYSYDPYYGYYDSGNKTLAQESDVGVEQHEAELNSASNASIAKREAALQDAVDDIEHEDAEEVNPVSKNGTSADWTAIYYYYYYN